MSRLALLLKRQDASSAAEFALVLPLLILFLLGIIDVGRYMWSVNKIEKATQMGARMAVVTNMVPGGLAAENYATALGQGNPIPTSSFGAATCQKPSGTVTCTCTTSPCPTLTPINSADPNTGALPFDTVSGRMKLIAPMIRDADVSIEYRNSGLGYAGDPNGSDIAPIVTVRAAGVPFRPLIFMFLGGRLVLPTVSASLTLEDGLGSSSN